MSLIELTLVQLTDIVRMWGVLAGVIGVTSFAHRIHLKWLGKPLPPIYNPEIDILAKFLVCMFLVLAGTIIPLSHKYQDGEIAELVYLQTIAMAWICVSSAGWCYVVSRAPRANLMTINAFVALILIFVAASFDYGG
jgi:hypothetical protein